MLADIAPDPTAGFGPYVAVGLLILAGAAVIAVIAVGLSRRRKRAR